MENSIPRKLVLHLLYYTERVRETKNIRMRCIIIKMILKMFKNQENKLFKNEIIH